ncbi:Multiple epidermal growth factor-like domains protein 8 [Mortierella sp. NVP41]|nr:Multiple epidermal growth factor-like domains protein 8 [Mortierella sp. NVP41]
MIANGSRRLVLAATAALTIACCSFTPTTVVVAMAQVMPTPIQDMAWVRSGSDLYIEGGYVSLNGVIQYTSSQFFALDLSTSWPVTSAPWRALANGTASRSFYGISLPSNQTILTFKFVAPTAYTITAYDVGTNTWSLARAVTTVPDILAYGLKPVMDPTSGLVYIAGVAGMNVYNWTSQTWSAPGPIMGAMLTARYFASAVYNTARDTIMYVGGYNYGVNPTHFDPQVIVTEYSPTTAKWSILPTSGSPPSPSADHCSAISEDGKTLVVFGGRTSVVTPTFTGALHFLDIDTGVWTAGPSQSTPRIYAVCALVGDQFVVWGGSADANNTLPSVQPIIFDLTLKQWVNSYKAPAYYLNNPPPKPNPTSGSGSNGSSGSEGTGSNNGGASGSSSGSGGSSSSSSSVGLGPIIGGVVGGLAVIGAIIGFLLYRRRQNKKLEEVKEQVSQQRMYIEAERSNKVVVHSSTTISYPTSPSYSPNNNTTAHDEHSKSSLSPHLQHKKQFAAAASSPIMSSPAVRTPPANNNNNNSPHGPKSTKKSNPQVYQPGGGAVSRPQEYYSPTGRAPQTFNNEADITGYYHEQESGRMRQNHPQEGAQHPGCE